MSTGYDKYNPSHNSIGHQDDTMVLTGGYDSFYLKQSERNLKSKSSFSKDRKYSPSSSSHLSSKHNLSFQSKGYDSFYEPNERSRSTTLSHKSHSRNAKSNYKLNSQMSGYDSFYVSKERSNVYGDLSNSSHSRSYHSDTHHSSHNLSNSSLSNSNLSNTLQSGYDSFYEGPNISTDKSEHQKSKHHAQSYSSSQFPNDQLNDLYYTQTSQSAYNLNQYPTTLPTEYENRGRNRPRRRERQDITNIEKPLTAGYDSFYQAPSSSKRRSISRSRSRDPTADTAVDPTTEQTKRERSRRTRRSSSRFSQKYISGNQAEDPYASVQIPKPPRRRVEDDDEEALRLGLILSQQEMDYGTNMFQELTPMEEMMLNRLGRVGYVRNDALQFLFELKFPPLKEKMKKSLKKHSSTKKARSPRIAQADVLNIKSLSDISRDKLPPEQLLELDKKILIEGVRMSIRESRRMAVIPAMMEGISDSHEDPPLGDQHHSLEPEADERTCSLKLEERKLPALPPHTEESPAVQDSSLDHALEIFEEISQQISEEASEDEAELPPEEQFRRLKQRKIKSAPSIAFGRKPVRMSSSSSMSSLEEVDLTATHQWTSDSQEENIDTNNQGLNKSMPELRVNIAHNLSSTSLSSLRETELKTSTLNTTSEEYFIDGIASSSIKSVSRDSENRATLRISPIPPISPRGTPRGTPRANLTRKQVGNEGVGTVSEENILKNMREKLRKNGSQRSIGVDSSPSSTSSRKILSRIGSNRSVLSKDSGEDKEEMKEAPSVEVSLQGMREVLRSFSRSNSERSTGSNKWEEGEGHKEECLEVMGHLREKLRIVRKHSDKMNQENQIESKESGLDVLETARNKLRKIPELKKEEITTVEQKNLISKLNNSSFDICSEIKQDQNNDSFTKTDLGAVEVIEHTEFNGKDENNELFYSEASNSDVDNLVPGVRVEKDLYEDSVSASDIESIQPSDTNNSDLDQMVPGVRVEKGAFYQDSDSEVDSHIEVQPITISNIPTKGPAASEYKQFSSIREGLSKDEAFSRKPSMRGGDSSSLGVYVDTGILQNVKDALRKVDLTKIEQEDASSYQSKLLSDVREQLKNVKTETDDNEVDFSQDTNLLAAVKQALKSVEGRSPGREALESSSRDKTDLFIRRKSELRHVEIQIKETVESDTVISPNPSPSKSEANIVVSPTTLRSEIEEHEETQEETTEEDNVVSDQPVGVDMRTLKERRMQNMRRLSSARMDATGAAGNKRANPSRRVMPEDKLKKTSRSNVNLTQSMIMSRKQGL